MYEYITRRSVVRFISAFIIPVSHSTRLKKRGGGGGGEWGSSKGEKSDKKRIKNRRVYDVGALVSQLFTTNLRVRRDFHNFFPAIIYNEKRKNDSSPRLFLLITAAGSTVDESQPRKVDVYGRTACRRVARRRKAE